MVEALDLRRGMQNSGTCFQMTRRESSTLGLDAPCTGVKACELLDTRMFSEGYRRYRREEDKVREIWEKELELKEVEGSSIHAAVARFVHILSFTLDAPPTQSYFATLSFYERALAKPCKLSSCDGKPVVQDLREKVRSHRSDTSMLLTVISSLGVVKWCSLGVRSGARQSSTSTATLLSLPMWMRICSFQCGIMAECFPTLREPYA